MITQLDTQSWAKELVTGNAEFVRTPGGRLFITSNARSASGPGFGSQFGGSFGPPNADFIILESDPVPPAAGPGASFSTVFNYVFPSPTGDFDPVCAYDTNTGNLHIIGTRDNPDNPKLVDLIKFTTSTSILGFGVDFGDAFGGTLQLLSGPTVLISGSTIRDAYDIVTLNSQHKFVAVSVTDPVFPPLQVANVAYVQITNNLLTITTTNNTLLPGQLVTLEGLTTATFLNNQILEVVSVTPAGFGNDFGNFFGGQPWSQFTANFDYDGFGSNFGHNFSGVYPLTADTGTATPKYSGHSLVTMELDANDQLVPGTLLVVANSPDRSGDAYSAVSLVSPDGNNVEIYYEGHPKLYQYRDQFFTIRNINRLLDAPITNVSLTSNLVTVTARQNFPVGTSVTLSGLTSATFLNGQVLTLLTASSTQFTASFTHADYATHSDTGFATAPAPIWDAAAVELTTFSGRFTDDRLTVLGDAQGNRYLSQTYYNQNTHPLGLVGNLMLGYFSPTSGWLFHPTFGTVVGGSIVQGTLSLSQTQGLSVVYLLDDMFQGGTSWPLHVATVDVSNLGLTEVPGFYNGVNFTWLRGTKNVIDDASLWAVVGERETGNAITPVYVSLFNVPPIATLTPTSATVYRNQALLLSSSTTDADQDLLQYVWTENDPDLADVTLQTSGTSATLLVSPAVGGAARSFSVGVVAFDLLPDAVTPRHPALVPTNVQLTANVVTVTVPNSLASTEQVLPYDISLAPPAAPTVNQTAGGTLGSRTYYVKVTYLNAVGESLASAETSFSISINNLALVTSPIAAGDPANYGATHYNVYVSVTTGDEQLQNQAPIALGTDWTEDVGGIINGPALPTDATAFLPWLNDHVLTVGTSTLSQFTAPLTHPDFVSTAVQGSVVPQFQFATCNITVPFNTAPVITFPIPTWGNPPAVSVARNSTIIITANPDPMHLTTQFPVTIAGVSDPDDTPTYTWTQLSGTPVSTPNGTFSPTLVFSTNGTDVHGEALVFQLTVDDGVNPAVDATCTFNVAAYSFVGVDTHQLSRAWWTTNGTTHATILDRNTAQIWGALDESVLYTDLTGVRRTSILDGTNRFVLLSRSSVMVFAEMGATRLLLRKLFTPNRTAIMDAFHTEDDATYVLDDQNMLYRYTTAPLINTDNPDTIFDLTTLSSLSFSKITATASFANNRVLVLSGNDGALLVQVSNDTLVVQGFMELTTASALIYGANDVQFVRTAGVESLRSGKVLLGTVAKESAAVTNIQITTNKLFVTCLNTFIPGDVVTLTGLTGASFLNGFTLTVLTAGSTQFTASFGHADYASTPDMGTATTENDGKTYETLIDLSHGQIIGTWDASKLRNQFVNTGEILFEPDTSYSGRPGAPLIITPLGFGSAFGTTFGGTVVANGTILIRWVEGRSDLVFAYNLEYSTDGVNFAVLQRVNSGAVQSLTVQLPTGAVYYFRIQAFSLDGASPYSNIVSVTT